MVGVAGGRLDLEGVEAKDETEVGGEGGRCVGSETFLCAALAGLCRETPVAPKDCWSRFEHQPNRRHRVHTQFLDHIIIGLF